MTNTPEGSAMSDKPAIDNIQKAVLVRVMPTQIWIENGLFGDSSVVLQHEGLEPFTYATFYYDYRYTSNSSVHKEVKKLAASLGASENVEFRARESKLNVLASLYNSIDALQKENLELKANHKFACENLASTVPFIQGLEQKIESLQAKIDSLMLEYCPDEMTAEQMENYAAHQVKAIICNH